MGVSSTEVGMKQLFRSDVHGAELADCKWALGTQGGGALTSVGGAPCTGRASESLPASGWCSDMLRSAVLVGGSDEASRLMDGTPCSGNISSLLSGGGRYSGGRSPSIGMNSGGRG